MSSNRYGMAVWIDHETYRRLSELAAASDRSLAKTIRVLVKRAKPEDVGAAEQVGVPSLTDPCAESQPQPAESPR